jgi:N-acetylmuramoyl-L-alanine amidase
VRNLLRVCPEYSVSQITPGYRHRNGETEYLGEVQQLDPPLTLFRFSSSLLAAAAFTVLLLLAVNAVGGQSPAQPALTILARDGRRQLPLTIANNQELVFLDELAAAFQLTVRDEPFGALAIGYKGKSILLTPDQPLVSIAGRLVSLPTAPTRSGRRLLVPVEIINRALTLIYDSRLDLRKPSRLLIVGDWRVPRVTMRLEGGDMPRIVVDAAPRTDSTVSQQNNALLIRFEADALDLAIPAFQPQPLVQAVRLVEPVTLAIDLGPRFGGFRASSQPLEASTRVTIDVMPALTDAPPPVAPPAAPPAGAPASTPPDLSALSQPSGGLRIIALDPGHGGEDEGVKGAGGTKEKDLALAVARRLKTAIESRLGIRVVLTREDDRNVAIATRAAIANNNKADLFISLHANASFQRAARGASILYAAFDRETEQSARASLGSERLPAFGGGVRDVDLVPWDLAQIRHIARSGEVAALLEERFHDRIPLSAHPVDRAPLDVLESANMPAVMLEMGYLTNAEQETQMTSPEFQNTLVQAVFDAVVQFRDSPGADAR